VVSCCAQISIDADAEWLSRPLRHDHGPPELASADSWREQAKSYVIPTAVNGKEEADAGIEIVRQNGTSWSVIAGSSDALSVGSPWTFPLALESRNSILSTYMRSRECFLPVCLSSHDSVRLRPLQVNAGAFVKVFAGDLCQAIEGFHGKPFCMFLRFAVFVLPSFRGGDGELCDGRTLLAVLHLGITAEISDQQNLLHGV